MRQGCALLPRAVQMSQVIDALGKHVGFPGPSGGSPGLDPIPTGEDPMTEQRPDTDERHEPGGTPSAGPDDLIQKPVAPGSGEGDRPSAVPGTYEADDAEQQRGKAVKPGN